jgi:hypothetical protein
MIDIVAVRSIVSQYESFGWKLERILLDSASYLSPLEFPGIPIAVGNLDALWFSRASGHSTSWELRRLSGAPFALVRVINADATDHEREQILESVETEMHDRAVKTSSENSNRK